MWINPHKRGGRTQMSNNVETAEERSEKSQSRRFFWTFILIGAAMLALFILARGSLRPIFIGAFLALLMKSMCNVLQRSMEGRAESKGELTKKKKRLFAFLSILITYAIWLGIIAVFLVLVIPTIGASLIDVATKLPSLIAGLFNSVLNFINGNEFLAKYSENIIRFAMESWEDWYSTSLRPTLTALGSGMINGISGTFSLLLDTFVGFIVSAYLLSGRKKLAAQLKLVLYAMLGEKMAHPVIALVFTKI